MNRNSIAFPLLSRRLPQSLPRSRKLTIGLSIMTFFGLIALVGPFFVENPNSTSLTALQPPSGEYWLGTTETGQDVFEQLVVGARGSMAIGLLAGLIAVAVAILVGVGGAYAGGRFDELMSLLSNIVLVIPVLPLVVLITDYVQSRSPATIAVIIAFTIWAASARVLRAQTLSLRSRDFVDAARVSGERPLRIMCVEVMPNLLPIIAAQFVFGVVFAILTEAGLAFLGLGVADNASWGSMLYFAKNAQALSLGAWWWFVPPGLCIALVGMALSLINFSIDELVNPRLRQPAGGSRRKRPARSQPADRVATADGSGPAECAEPDPAGGRDLVLSVRNLSVEYAGERPVRAVREASFDLSRGEILGLAGESGCGKSTLAYAVTRLLRPPAEIVGGAVEFVDHGDRDGRDAEPSTRDLLSMTGEELRLFRWQRMAMVFQGAMNALNPVLTIERQFDHVFTDHALRMSRQRRRERSAELLELVGIDPTRLSSYPYELSGGMRQRVMIAMALALRPDVLIMDEPTTALDVVVQREILDELDRLREMFGFSVVFITHDLPLLLEISDRVAIMYAGGIVEQGTAARIRNAPYHPYTVGLVNSFPTVRGARRDMRGIPGSPPDLARESTGCAFTPRCPYALDICPTRPVPATPAACHLYDPAAAPDGPPAALRRGEFPVTWLDAADRPATAAPVTSTTVSSR